MKKIDKYSNDDKRAMRDELESLINTSGLSNARYAKERLGFNDGSKLNHVLKSWDKKGMVGSATWDAVAKHINKSKGYKGVATDNLKKVWSACDRAYSLKKNIVISGEGGLGKTFALEKYKEKIEKDGRFEVIYVDASMTSTRKQLVVALMQEIGCYKSGVINAQLIEIKKAMKKRDALLVIDEVSSLKGDNVTILKDVMTALKDVCGLILAGTPYFVNNLNKGAHKDKHLFSETKDRLFMLPVSLNKPTEAEAEAIFKMNGLSGEALKIMMGKDKATYTMSYKVKQTFRGIADCIATIQMAENETKTKVEYLQAI